MGHRMRVWYLSHCKATKDQARLRIRADSPDPSLLAYTKYGCRWRSRRKLRPLAPPPPWKRRHGRFIRGICAYAVSTEISCLIHFPSCICQLLVCWVINLIFFLHGFRKLCRTFLLMRVERGPYYHLKRAIIGSPAKRQVNGISLAGRWWPNIE